MKISDFDFLRYNGEVIELNGFNVRTRSVVGLNTDMESVVLAVPSAGKLVSVMSSVGDQIKGDSRQFRADPTALFPDDFDWETPSAALAPESDEMEITLEEILDDKTLGVCARVLLLNSNRYDLDEAVELMKARVDSAGKKPLTGTQRIKVTQAIVDFDRLIDVHESRAANDLCQRLHNLNAAGVITNQWFASILEDSDVSPIELYKNIEPMDFLPYETGDLGGLDGYETYEKAVAEYGIGQCVNALVSGACGKVDVQQLSTAIMDSMDRDASIQSPRYRDIWEEAVNSILDIALAKSARDMRVMARTIGGKFNDLETRDILTPELFIRALEEVPSLRPESLTEGLTRLGNQPYPKGEDTLSIFSGMIVNQGVKDVVRAAVSLMTNGELSDLRGQIAYRLRNDKVAPEYKKRVFDTLADMQDIEMLGISDKRQVTEYVTEGIVLMNKNGAILASEIAKCIDLIGLDPKQVADRINRNRELQTPSLTGEEVKAAREEQKAAREEQKAAQEATRTQDQDSESPYADDAEQVQTPESERSAERLESMALETFNGRKPIFKRISVTGGGTLNNYKVVKLSPLGSAGEMKVQPYTRTSLASYVPQNQIHREWNEPSPEIVKDLQDNVFPALGLRKPLGFKQMFVAIGDPGSGSYILSFTTRGRVMGVICLDPAQIIKYLGGFNSATVGHVLTHEIAHYIDRSLMRNVARREWDAALRGKIVHPLGKGSDAASMSTEHFATLAELMVWGYSLRQVYYLNGFDVVNKFFVSRYIKEDEILPNTL